MWPSEADPDPAAAVTAVVRVLVCTVPRSERAFGIAASRAVRFEVVFLRHAFAWGCRRRAGLIPGMRLRSVADADIGL